MKLLLLFISAIVGRQIMIGSKKTFTFFEPVEEGNIFKFIYNTKFNVNVTIRDPNNNKVINTSNIDGTFYTKVTKGGNFKLIIENRGLESSIFSYKCPDPNKELPGHLGYVKDSDMVGDLARVLDELIIGQENLINRANEHQKMVINSRSWAQILTFIEFLLTGLVVYVMHKDFINMFEQKRTL